MEAARAQLQAAHAALKTAEATFSAAFSEYEFLRSSLDVRIQRKENQFRAAALPAIQEFISWCWRQCDEVRHNEVQSREVVMYRTLHGRREIVTENNYDSILATLTALRRAAQTAEALKAEDRTDEEINTRLAEIAATIPSVQGLDKAPSPRLSFAEEALARKNYRDLAVATVKAHERKR